MFQLLLTWASRKSRSASPSASQTDFDFCRWAIEEGNVDDVDLQVLVQCRSGTDHRTFEALKAPR